MTDYDSECIVRMLRVSQSDPLQQEAADALEALMHDNDVMGKQLLKQAEENTRLREEVEIFRGGFDGLTRGNQELQRQILSQYAAIDEMITTKGKLLKALQSIAIIEDEKRARAIAFEVLDELYGVD